jgi:hypothetical protein
MDDKRVLPTAGAPTSADVKLHNSLMSLWDSIPLHNNIHYDARGAPVCRTPSTSIAAGSQTGRVEHKYVPPRMGKSGVVSIDTLMLEGPKIKVRRNENHDPRFNVNPTELELLIRLSLTGTTEGQARKLLNTFRASYPNYTIYVDEWPGSRSPVEAACDALEAQERAEVLAKKLNQPHITTRNRKGRRAFKSAEKKKHGKRRR